MSAMDAVYAKAAVVSALCEEALLENYHARKRRKEWVHKMWKKRKSTGEFSALFYDSIGDDRKFQEYYEMSYEQFLQLLDIIKPGLTKRNTSFREAVGPKKRLAV
jgi:hypothetical protein